MTEDNAIALVENGTYSFYVAEGDKTVDVVATHSGRKYLKTEADGDHPRQPPLPPGVPVRPGTIRPVRALPSSGAARLIAALASPPQLGSEGIFDGGRHRQLVVAEDRLGGKRAEALDRLNDLVP